MSIILRIDNQTRGGGRGRFCATFATVFRSCSASCSWRVQTVCRSCSSRRSKLANDWKCTPRHGAIDAGIARAHRNHAWTHDETPSGHATDSRGAGQIGDGGLHWRGDLHLGLIRSGAAQRPDGAGYGIRRPVDLSTDRHVMRGSPLPCPGPLCRAAGLRYPPFPTRKHEWLDAGTAFPSGIQCGVPKVRAFE